MKTPDGWELEVLGEVLVRSEYGTSVPVSDSGTRPIIGMRSIGDGRVNTSEFGLIVDDPALEHLILRRGDILLNRTNSPSLVGKTGIVASDTQAVFASYLVRLVVDRQRADARFVSHWLNFGPTQTHIRKLATRGVSQANVNPTTLKSQLPIPVPPLPEQHKIADILGAWDDAIEALAVSANKKRVGRELLVEQLVFPAGKPQGLSMDRVPSSWQARRIADVASEVSVRNRNLDATVVLTCSKHRGFVLNTDYFDRSTQGADLSGYKLIRRDQFGFPSNHVEEGSIGVQNLVDVGIVSPIYTVFEFSNQVAAQFAYLVLKTNAYRHMFQVSTSASVARRGSLRWREFSRLPFPVPPVEEQRAICSAVASVDQELALLDREIALLKEQKRGLMQKLLTGDIRVTVDPTEEAAP